jgi:hypothetical protein
MIYFECTVDNRWEWSLESACITLYSPNGGHVRIDKKKFHLLTDTHRNLFWELLNRITDNRVGLTIPEMKMLAVMGMAAGRLQKKQK